MMQITGKCRFCGQQHMLDTEEELKDGQADEMATRSCQCDIALDYQEKVSRADVAKGKIKELFGEGAGTYRLDGDAYDILISAVDEISEKSISAITVKIKAGVTAKIARMAKDKIKVTREIKSSTSFEQ